MNLVPHEVLTGMLDVLDEALSVNTHVMSLRNIPLMTPTICTILTALFSEQISSLDLTHCECGDGGKSCKAYVLKTAKRDILEVCETIYGA